VDRPVKTERVPTLGAADRSSRPTDPTDAGAVLGSAPAVDTPPRWPFRDLRLTRVAATGAIPELRCLARRWAADSGLHEDIAEDMVLAVDEAVTNVVEHAYPDVTGAVRVQLTRREGGELTVVIEDDGTWRPPPADPGFRGRGLSLITRLADHAHINPTSTGTVVRMNWAAQT
jgi:anti-sigma regulatory factor (Ser/Thr protein kinase)